MKIYLYSEGLQYIAKSGVGKSIKHQMKALEENNIIYTTVYEEDIDIVHINTIGINSHFLAKKMKKQGVRVVVHAHSTEEDFKNSFKFSNILAPSFKVWITKIYNLADIIITPTNYSKDLLETKYKINKPIVAISNGVDLEKFAYDAEKIKAFKKYFKIKKQKVFMSVGLQIERKGILDFIDLAFLNPDDLFIWFGDTPDILMTYQVKKALKTAPVNCIFPGFIDSDVLQGAYLGCDAFLFMTKEETEGIVVLEALASKTLVIISDIPVYDDWLDDHVNCLKCSNIIEFQKTLNDVKKNDFQSIKENGYKIAVQKKLKNIGLQLSEVYKDEIKKK